MTAAAEAPQPPVGRRKLTAAEIASITGGEVKGDPSRVVSGAGPLERAEADQISFLGDRRYAPLLAGTRAGVVLVRLQDADAPAGDATRVIVAKPYDAMLAVLPQLFPALPRPSGIHPSAVIGEGARIADDAAIEAGTVVGAGCIVGPRTWVGPHCVLGRGVVLGADVHLVGHVTCYAGTEVGDRTVVHAGARLGSDGFGYAFVGGEHRKVPHVGRCVIGADVEIGANTCVDRGSIDDTLVGAGTKIDNLVHIAHNVHIGRLCLLMAQVGIAGSARIGDGVIVAGQAGIGGHARIGARARIGAQAGVFGDVPEGETWSGYPARPHTESLRASAALQRLSGLIRRIERLLDGAP